MRPPLLASGRRRGEVPPGTRACSRLAAGHAAGIRRIVEALPRMFATPEEPRERPGLKGGGMAAF